MISILVLKSPGLRLGTNFTPHSLLSKSTYQNTTNLKTSSLSTTHQLQSTSPGQFVLQKIKRRRNKKLISEKIHPKIEVFSKNEVENCLIPAAVTIQKFFKKQLKKKQMLTSTDEKKAGATPADSEFETPEQIRKERLGESLRVMQDEIGELARRVLEMVRVRNYFRRKITRRKNSQEKRIEFLSPGDTCRSVLNQSVKFKSFDKNLNEIDEIQCSDIKFSTKSKDSMMIIHNSPIGEPPKSIKNDSKLD
jgi:HAMP domain-containing protein